MTDKPKCKGQAFNPHGTWGRKYQPCRRNAGPSGYCLNAGPSGYCHQHVPSAAEADPSLGVLHSLRYSGYSGYSDDAKLVAEDVPILSRTAKVCRISGGLATDFKNSANIGSDGIAVLQSSDRTIVVVGTDKAAVSARMRALLAERKDNARRELDRWCTAQLELEAMAAADREAP